MNEINTIDFEDDQLERVNDSGLLSIADCCQRLVDLENEASTLEEQLNHRKQEMLSIRNEKIPAIMQGKNNNEQSTKNNGQRCCNCRRKYVYDRCPNTERS